MNRIGCETLKINLHLIETSFCQISQGELLSGARTIERKTQLIAESLYEDSNIIGFVALLNPLHFAQRNSHGHLYVMKMAKISNVDSQLICCCFSQISDVHVTGESEDMTAKERLLLWSQQMTEGYIGVRCDNFTTSWKDGKLFNAIIHKYR